MLGDCTFTANKASGNSGLVGSLPEDTLDLGGDGDPGAPGLPLDLARGDRFLGTGPTVDMGAYEYLNPGDGLGDPEPPPAGAPAPEPSGTAYIAFTYDALGRRIERTVDSGGANVEVTRYYWDGQNVVLEANADEAPRRSFVHGSQYVDERVLMRLPNGQEYYYLPRELYSVAALTDETGEIVEAATYDTYGQVAVYDGSAQAVEESPVGNPYYFTGRRLDLLPLADGLKQVCHYRYRAYEPSNGRFMQRDALSAYNGAGRLTVAAIAQYRDGMDLYQYVRGRPLRLLDADGAQSIDPNAPVTSQPSTQPAPCRRIVGCGSTQEGHLPGWAGKASGGNGHPFGTGEEFLDILKEESKDGCCIEKLVVVSHGWGFGPGSAGHGVGGGFYGSGWAGGFFGEVPKDKEGKPLPGHENARDLSHLQEMISKGDVKFCKPCKITFTGCRIASTKDFVPRLAHITGCSIIAARGGCDGTKAPIFTSGAGDWDEKKGGGDSGFTETPPEPDQPSKSIGGSITLW